jgi:hypothetical protein
VNSEDRKAGNLYWDHLCYNWGLRCIIWVKVLHLARMRLVLSTLSLMVNWTTYIVLKETLLRLGTIINHFACPYKLQVTTFQVIESRLKWCEVTQTYTTWVKCDNVSTSWVMASSPALLSVWPCCTLKLNEEKSKHIGLSQQKGLLCGLASFCTVSWDW